MDSAVLSDAALTENGTMKTNDAKNSQKTVNAESTTKLPQTQEPKTLLRSEQAALLDSSMKDELKGFRTSDVVKVCLTFLDKLLGEVMNRDIISLTHVWTVNQLVDEGFDEETAKRILAVILVLHEAKRSQNPMSELF